MIHNYIFIFTVFFAFYLGFKTAKNIENTGDLPDIRPLFKQKAPPKTIEAENAEIFMQNIENFGTAAEQREYKR